MVSPVPCPPFPFPPFPLPPECLVLVEFPDFNIYLKDDFEQTLQLVFAFLLYSYYTLFLIYCLIPY